MVFYLKYRPKTLAELDNEEVVTLITKYLGRASLPHAFLFTGPKGTGKTSTARILAKSINCISGKQGVACGTCDICLSIGRGDNLDVLEIDAASNRGIDEIRDLREKIKLVPTHLSYKVYIIDEVHMLTTEAFNALLKTLEEPPRHAVFILATTEAHKVPDTIISRCVRVEFHKATTDELIHSLRRVVTGENLKIDEEALTEITRLADGSFRDAAKLLEELTLSGTTITLTQVRVMGGLTDTHLIQEFLSGLHEKRAKELLVLIQKLSTEGKNVRQFFLQVLSLLEQLLINYFTKESDWRKDDLVKAITLLSRSFAELKSSVIPTLPFELAVVEYCADTPSKTVASQDKMQKPLEVKTGGTQKVTTGSDESARQVGESWNEIIENTKTQNHSIAGVLRSCKPINLVEGILTIEAAYKFHAERLMEPKVRDVLAKAIKDVVGLEVKVEVVTKKRT